MKSRCFAFLALLAVVALALAPTAYAQIPGMTGIDIGPRVGYDPGSDPLPGDGFVDAGTGEWVVWGGGNDIWNNADSFHYEYGTMTGDFQATYRIKNLQLTDGWAKAGIMARNDLTPGSVYAMTRASAGNQTGSMQARNDPNGGSWSGGSNAPNSNMAYPGVAPVWQRLTRVEKDFFVQWAPDVNGAPGNWSFPQDRRITNSADTMYLGIAVTSHNTSRVTEALVDHYQAGSFVLEGMDGGAGYFGVREVVDNGNMDNQTLATRSLLSPNTGSYVDYKAPVINIYDSGTATPFPNPGQFRVIDKEWRVNGLVDHIALLAKGKIMIPEADTYTFAVSSDDGFRLSIDGKVVGSFEGGRGMSSTFMPVDLTAGKHTIQLTYHEGGGGSGVALSALRGAWADMSDRNWRLVGDSMPLVIPAGDPAGTMKPIESPPGVVVGNFAIKEVHRTDNLAWNDATLGGDNAALANAKARLDAPDPADVVFTGYSDTVNFNDPDNPGGAGSFGVASRSPFIGDTPLADDNNFAVRANGTLVIPAAGDYSFGVHSDDGFSLKIGGATFSGVIGGQIDPANPDTIQFPTPTGDSNTIGHVTLAAGEYPIQLDMYECGGGAFVELSATKGFKDTIDNSFVLLGGTPREGYTIPGGLELVGDVTVVAGDANKDGRVDVFDVAILQTNFGTTGGATWEMGDFNGDGKVDVFDVGLLQPNFGYGVGGSPAAAVPEPASLVLAGLGLLGLLAYGLRRKEVFMNLKLIALIAVIVAVAGLGTAKAADLVGADIGNPLRAGSTVKTGNVYTVKGGGTDIWNQTDQFHFASADWTGDFIATVRMDRLRAADAWSKGGLMARETLYRGSRDVYNVSTPANGISFQWRPDTGVGATWGGTPLQGSFYSTYGSVWQLLMRQGSVFTGAWAPDINGQPGGWLSPQTYDSAGKLPDTLKVGLALTSHDNNQLTRAVFSSYNIVAPDPANPLVFDTPQAYGELVSLPNGKVGGKAFGLTTNAQAVFGPAIWNVQKGTLNAAGSPGLKGEWFNGNMNWSNLMFTIVQPNIDWKDSGAPGYPAATGWTGNHDNYSVRLTGEINLPAGTYNFWDSNDDYAKLTINGATLIDDNTWTGYNSPSTHIPAGMNTITIDAAGWYPIEFLMAEGGGGDNGQLFWDAGVAGGAKTLVPAANFRLAEDVLSFSQVASGRGNVGNLTTNGQFGDVTVENGATYKLNISVGYGLNGSVEQVLGGAGSPAAVPEPSTMVLAGLGLVGLLAYGWRRRK